jgi:hypothetical protein
MYLQVRRGMDMQSYKIHPCCYFSDPKAGKWQRKATILYLKNAEMNSCDRLWKVKEKKIYFHWNRKKLWWLKKYKRQQETIIKISHNFHELYPFKMTTNCDMNLTTVLNQSRQNDLTYAFAWKKRTVFFAIITASVYAPDFVWQQCYSSSNSWNNKLSTRQKGSLVKTLFKYI